MNRDLLVAVLALITDAIPRRVLSDALAEWSRDRSRSLAQVLLSRHSIEPERLDALVCLTESHLDRHNGDLRTCLDSWNALGATQDLLTRVDDHDLESTLGLTVPDEATVPAEPGECGADETIAAGEAGDETVAVSEGGGGGAVAAPAAPGAERFRPIRLHARGGIGQVWVARDGELQREVALKVIQDRYADRADQRSRFLLEAEITGNLEHPGIVPVYSLGRDERGRPYYAMRFIRGQSLAAAIRQFHLRWRAQGAEAGRGGAMWGVDFRQLLGRFLDVCDAIDYAHSRGVLHRDIKPANIMLGRYGETLVVDWGLAKVIDRPDIAAATADADVEPTLTATHVNSSSGETQPGTTIGTPSYMSPEQARGAVDEMGTTSDVYSLGATLYEILTGEVAFAGKKTADVLRRVVAGDFRPPREVLRSIPAPLEAICLKAMALDRRRRYDTVRELAVDIQHWLADEPVAAMPEGRLRRMGRWLRRHRTWTYAAGAALMGITLAATIGLVLLERGRRREADARALAETNFNLARKAVEDYFNRVSEDTLLKEQDSVDIRRLRAELLSTALGYYRKFLNQRSGDPQIRREMADAQFRVGKILREIDTPDEAVEAYEASIKLWRELLDESPGAPDLLASLARTYMALGEQWAQVRQFPRAFDAFGRSRDILTRLRDEGRGEASTRFSLAECDKELGIAEAEAGVYEKGLEHLGEAKAILRKLLEEAPGDSLYGRRLADTINGEGFIHAEKGRDDDALAAFREFQEICRGLIGDDRSSPVPPEILNKLALSYYNVGSILFRQGQGAAKVLENFEKSLAYRSALVEAHRSVKDFREKMAVSLAEVAPFRREVGREKEAMEAARKSVQMLDDLVKAEPDQPRYRAELGRSLNILGYLVDEARDNAQALDLFVRALREMEIAERYSPKTERYRSYEVDILLNLGEQHVDLGRPEVGLPYLRRAVDIRRKLLEAHAGERVHTMEMVDAIEALARFARQGGAPGEAERSCSEAGAILERLDPAAADPEVQGRRGASLLAEGRAAADQGHDDRALEVLRRSVAILTRVVAAGGRDPEPRKRLTEALWETARVLRRGGDSKEADALDARRRALWEGGPPGALAELAMEETALAATVGYGRLPANRRVEAVRRLDLDLAAENLRMAVAMGLRDSAALLRNRDASLLFDREDVRPLVPDIVFPDIPFTMSPGSETPDR